MTAHAVHGQGGRAAAVAAGSVAGLAGLSVFLILHHIWITPIWFVAPAGAVLALAGGAAWGVSYVELCPTPLRPWATFKLLAMTAAVLLPAIVIADIRGPIYRMDADGGGTLLVPGPQALLDVILGLLFVATLVGASLGWWIARHRRAVVSTALAAFLLALGPGHNIPLLGGTPAAGKGLAILALVIAVASFVLVEGQAWAAARRPARDETSRTASASRSIP